MEISPKGMLNDKSRSLTNTNGILSVCDETVIYESIYICIETVKGTKRKRLRRKKEGGWRRFAFTFPKGGSRGVSRALMFPWQETLSPSYALYLFACSPIFIRLYLKLELVPLHFLLRSSPCLIPSFFFLCIFFFLLFFFFPFLTNPPSLSLSFPPPHPPLVPQVSVCPPSTLFAKLLWAPMRWQQHANIPVFAIRMATKCGCGRSREARAVFQLSRKERIYTSTPQRIHVYSINTREW